MPSRPFWLPRIPKSVSRSSPFWPIDETFKVASAENAHEAMDFLENKNDAVCVVLSDLRIAGADCLDLLSFVKSHDRPRPRSCWSRHAPSSPPIDALKEGAYDYVQKPFDTISCARGGKGRSVSICTQTENQRLHGKGRVLRKREIIRQVPQAKERVDRLIRRRRQPTTPVC